MHQNHLVSVEFVEGFTRCPDGPTPEFAQRKSSSIGLRHLRAPRRVQPVRARFELAPENLGERRLHGGERPYWRSSLTHHPRNPPKVFERVARMMLLEWGDAWQPPWGVSLEDRVEDGDELAHGGDQ